MKQFLDMISISIVTFIGKCKRCRHNDFSYAGFSTVSLTISMLPGSIPSLEIHLPG